MSLTVVMEFRVGGEQAGKQTLEGHQLEAMRLSRLLLPGTQLTSPRFYPLCLLYMYFADLPPALPLHPCAGCRAHATLHATQQIFHTRDTGDRAGGRSAEYV